MNVLEARNRIYDEIDYVFDNDIWERDVLKKRVNRILERVI